MDIQRPAVFSASQLTVASRDPLSSPPWVGGVLNSVRFKAFRQVFFFSAHIAYMETGEFTFMWKDVGRRFSPHGVSRAPRSVNSLIPPEPGYGPGTVCIACADGHGADDE